MVEAGFSAQTGRRGWRARTQRHKVHGFVQAHQEAGHLRVGDGDGLARFDLVDKQGDNAAAAGHDVAVAGAADGGSLGLDGARLRADNFFHHCLADSHGIDGVRRFIGGEADDLFYARVDGGCQYVVGAQHVGAHGSMGKNSQLGTCLSAAAWKI